MPYPAKTDRKAILAAALEQVARDGLAALSLRSVAATLGLAPNALYRYFADRAALEAALAEESQRQLFGVLQTAVGRKPPEAAIRGLARAYVRFARDKPQLFALTLLPSVAEAGSEPAHIAMWRFVQQQVSNLYGARQTPEAAVALWAFLHGMTALEAAGVLGSQKPTSSFEFGLQLWIAAAPPAIHQPSTSRG